MLVVFVLLYCLSFVFEIQATLYKENITDFSKCKNHISQSDGKYSEFYEIDKGTSTGNNSLLFDFHFSVLARSNAHILLSESDIIQKTDPVYEIVIGAGGNTFTELRRQQKSTAKVSAWIKDLLSATDVRSFWIHIWNDGLIQIGKETEELSFLSWKDSEPLNLKYFSFSTWPGVEAKWFFDCYRNTNRKSEIIQTNREKLLQDLFQNYNIFSRPVLNDSDIMDIDLQLVPQYISLDEATSKLEIKGGGYMKWKDEKLYWKADNYGGIKLLRLPVSRIWIPDLRLYEYQVNLKDAIVYQNGSVFCNIALDVNYWCNITDLASWPSDVHECPLSFSFMRDSDRIRPHFVNQTKDFFTHGVVSGWLVTDLKIEYTPVKDHIYYNYDEVTSVRFLLTIERMSGVYKLIYLSPIFVISICSLMTFWASPSNYLKITLCCVQLIVETAILIHISITIPGHPTKVPTLVMLYSSSFISTAVLVVISVIVINLSRSRYENYCMPEILISILSSSPLQRFLCLPDISNESDYGELSDNSTRTQEDLVKSVWVLLGAVIDRICFIIYSFLFIIAISQNY